MTDEIKVCPICGQKIAYPAISRSDNKTEICSDCGVREALEDFAKHLKEINVHTLLKRKEDF